MKMAELQCVEKREVDTLTRFRYWTHNYHTLIHTKGGPNMHEILKKVYNKPYTDNM